jgi:hypothetical protein
VVVPFWDASALVKRYLLESGSDTVNALFAAVPRDRMVTTPWGYAETYSVLLRRLNGGILDLPMEGLPTLNPEVLAAADVPTFLATL